LDRPAREVVLAAAAADDDCLSVQASRARRNSRRVTVLASRKDNVLRVAYRAGDFVSDIFFRDTDDASRCALGFHGPVPAGVEGVSARQLPEKPPYGHSDYLPAGGPPDPRDRKAAAAVRYMRAALMGESPGWPPA
jgi:hypothetical protein